MTKSAAAAARQRASKETGITKRARKAVAKGAAAVAEPAEVPAENNLPEMEETPCIPETQVADSGHQTETSPATADLAPEVAPGGRKMAKWTLKGLSKNQRQAIYLGEVEDGGRVKTAIRIPVAAFKDKQAPSEFTADAPFAVRAKARSEMTPEERKAARAARPKLTLAEKAQKAEARAARLRAQAEAEARQEVAPALT